MKYESVSRKKNSFQIKGTSVCSKAAFENDFFSSFFKQYWCNILEMYK